MSELAAHRERLRRNEDILALYEYGVAMQEIADEHGLSRMRVWQIVREAAKEGKVERKSIGVRRALNGYYDDRVPVEPTRTKEAIDRNADVLSMYERGVGLAEIGRKHGISKSRVSGIAREAFESGLIKSMRGRGRPRHANDE